MSAGDGIALAARTGRRLRRCKYSGIWVATRLVTGREAILSQHEGRHRVSQFSTNHTGPDYPAAGRLGRSRRPHRGSADARTAAAGWCPHPGSVSYTHLTLPTNREV